MSCSAKLTDGERVFETVAVTVTVADVDVETVTDDFVLRDPLGDDVFETEAVVLPDFCA